MKTLPYIPGKGHGTLPLCDAHANANLLTVFLDAQHDFLCDRLYAVAARVVAHDGGEYAGRRLLVQLSDGPPETPDKEREMLAHFLGDLLRALPEKAAPDDRGRLRAPIHIVCWNGFVWESLLAGLARHLDSLLSEFPAVYDLLTQKAAFALPLTTFLDSEFGRKHLPLVCPSLTNVASYLRFDWGEFGDEDGPDAVPYRQAFRARLFDATGRFEDTDVDNKERGLLHGPRSLQQPGAAGIRLRRLGRASPAGGEQSRPVLCVPGCDRGHADRPDEAPPQGTGPHHG